MSYSVHSLDKNRELTGVADVSFARNFRNEATEATVELFSREEAQSLNLNETIEIRNREGDRVFIGNVKTTPTGDTQRTYTIKAKQRYVEAFEFHSNNRVFYQEDSGTVMRKLITEDIESRGKELALTCDSLDMIESDAPVVELGEFSTIRPEDYGDDIIFIGYPKNIADDNKYHATFPDIEFKGDELQRLEMRLILNNISGVMDITVQYVDDDNTNYVWELGDSVDGVKELELRVDEARDIDIDKGLDPESNPNTLRIVTEIQGEPVESRAIGIDSIKTASVDVVSRPHGFNSVNIPDTGRPITRRFTESVSEAIYAILEEEKGKLIVDEEDNVQYREAGERDAELEIIKGETPVVSLDVDTDVTRIRNHIVVQGEEDLVVSKESDASRRFFDQTKTYKRRDESIKRETDAIDKANELLNELAFRDTEITVVMPNTGVFEKARTGDNVRVEWDNIQNEFILDEIQDSTDEFIELTLVAESHRF